MISSSRSRVIFDLQEYPRDVQRLVVNILCFSDVYVIVGSIHELSPARIEAQPVVVPFDGRHVRDADLDAARVNARDMLPRNAGRYLEYEWALGYVHRFFTNNNHGIELNNTHFCLVLVSANVERGPVLYTDPRDANTGRINSHIDLYITATRHYAGYFYNIM